MSSPLTLMELSDDDKLKILEQCNLESIFALRRTCHDFCNLIDDKKPDAKIEYISVAFYNYCNSLSVDVQSDDIRLEYRPVDGGCIVAKSKSGESEKEFLFPGENRMDIFVRNFKTIMGCRKKVLPMMSLCSVVCDGTIELFHYYLKTRKNLMKVEHLQLNLPKQSQIVQFLPCFDANYLQSINISFNDSNELSQELVSLDQWKNAKNATISEFNLGMMDHCMHFEKMTVSVDHSVRDAEDIPAFKRKMHESPYLQTMTMFFDSNSRIYEQLGISVTLQSDGEEFTR